MDPDGTPTNIQSFTLCLCPSSSSNCNLVRQERNTPLYARLALLCFASGSQVKSVRGLRILVQLTVRCKVVHKALGGFLTR